MSGLRILDFAAIRRASGRMRMQRKLTYLIVVFTLGSFIFLVEDKLSYLNPKTGFPMYSMSRIAKKSGLNVANKMTESFKLDGTTFNIDGPHANFKATIQVSLIHSYSPYTENHFREMMIDPVRDEHKIYANSPAILQMTDSGEIITVMRIWLEKEIWTLTNKQPHNFFQDNYFYIQRFNHQMKPITEGRILGIPTPVQWSIGDGPIEPRIFTVNETIYLTFNTGVFTESRKAIDSTFFWDLSNNKALLPKITGGQPMVDTADSMPRDKHWSALVNDTKLYLAYNLDPLRVIDCRLSSVAECKFVHKEGDVKYKFNDRRDCLRGGTPFVLYDYPYYISIAHGTFFRDCQGENSRCNGLRYYTTHLVVMIIEPDFKIIYISGNIPFPEASLTLPIVRYRFISSSFVFPVGLILENLDSLVLGGHINDHSSVLYRISNVSSVITNAINYHKKYPNKPGPLPGMLQNYTRYMAEKFSGMKFLYEK